MEKEGNSAWAAFGTRLRGRSLAQPGNQAMARRQGARAGHAHGVVTAPGLRAQQCGGALAGGATAADRWQGLSLKDEGGARQGVGGRGSPGSHFDGEGGGGGGGELRWPMVTVE
jgi:hypothetical protein